MALPFLTSTTYQSQVWPLFRLEHRDSHIIAYGGGALECLSSAVYNGGLRTADSFMNWQVQPDYDCSDPVGDLKRTLAASGYPASTVGLITAAPVEHASVLEGSGDRFEWICCTTLGLGGAARGGQKRNVYPSYIPGTINTMLFIRGRVSQAALVNLVITAAEAKAAALADMNVNDKELGLPATGTPTDAIIIGASQTGPVPEIHEYTGLATTLGNAVSCAVYDSICEAAADYFKRLQVEV
ncbi:adenosylcobinamide amidohydrolase [Paenibacillus sp. GCM10012307]|uniref:Adenosylcobinamide amidohydrolase n=1 Tax=Paenibacillus roseus TaxID=2798579 RepID=A0A934J9K5_9BACL|nr:adenosylcobinamide amidohydrolase [Paenibacillus roseus]MBJ6364068.1 adenosylcobinamide amidohydrolase [Paenibacillus roseus]